jgi:hypothetical protein
VPRGSVRATYRPLFTGWASTASACCSGPSYHPASHRASCRCPVWSRSGATPTAACDPGSGCRSRRPDSSPCIRRRARSAAGMHQVRRQTFSFSLHPPGAGPHLDRSGDPLAAILERDQAGRRSSGGRSKQGATSDQISNSYASGSKRIEPDQAGEEDRVGVTRSRPKNARPTARASRLRRSECNHVTHALTPACRTYGVRVEVAVVFSLNWPWVKHRGRKSPLNRESVAGTALAPAAPSGR